MARKKDRNRSIEVRDLYELMSREDEDWQFLVYVDGISGNILASCNSYYDVHGSKNKGNSLFDNLYSVEDLFEHEVLSFRACGAGIHVEIAKFPGMKYRELSFYMDEQGKEKADRVVKVWGQEASTLVPDV